MILNVFIFIGGIAVGYTTAKIVCKEKDNCVCKKYAEINDFTQFKGESE